MLDCLRLLGSGLCIHNKPETLRPSCDTVAIEICLFKDNIMNLVDNSLLHLYARCHL